MTEPRAHVIFGAGQIGTPLAELLRDRCSRKGEIRAQVNERLMAAHERGDVRAVVARGSDFHGP